MADDQPNVEVKFQPPATDYPFEPWTLNGPLSILLGILVGLGISILIIILLPARWKLDGFEKALVALAVTAIVVTQGLREVPTVHVGQIKFLGKRISWIVLGEGYGWLPLPWPFLSIDFIGVMVKQIQVPPKENPKPFEIPIKLKNPNGSKETVVVTASMVMTGRVVSPQRYTTAGARPGVTTAEEEGPVERKVVATARTTLRALGQSGKYDDETFAEKKDEIAIAVRNEMNKLTVPQWGWEIETLQLPSVLPDPETLKARQLTAKERAEAQAEGIQADAQLKRIERYVKLGLTPQDAVNVDQAERGKAERDINVIQSGSQEGGNKQGHKGKGGKPKPVDPSIAAAVLIKSALPNNPNQQGHQPPGD